MLLHKLLSSGALYFARDRHRWTALMWAVAGGHDETVELLIGFVKKHKLKSFLNAKDSITGWTALHVSNCDFFENIFLLYYPIESTWTSAYSPSFPKNFIFSLQSLLSVSIIQENISSILLWLQPKLTEKRMSLLNTIVLLSLKWMMLWNMLNPELSI